MKTNTLYVCQFCDKKLGSKRTVRLHISNIHKVVDPDNPIMYHMILVSPRIVTNLLKSVVNKTQRTLKVINQDTVLEELGSNQVIQSGSEQEVESGLDEEVVESGLDDEVVESGLVD